MKTESRCTDKKNDGHNKCLEKADKKWNFEEANQGQKITKHTITIRSVKNLGFMYSVQYSMKLTYLC